MHTPKWMRILSLFLVITFFTGLISPYDRQSVSAETNEAETAFATKRIIDRFGVTEAFIQQYTEAGYTLNDIYSALFKAEGEDLPFAEALGLLVSEPVNISSSVSGSVYNDLTPGALQDLIVLKEEDLTVTGQVYGPTASESVYGEPSVTETVYGIPRAFLNVAVDKPPIMETAPVYDKTKMNEAPYAVGNNQEAISTLSGSMSIGQADLTLPGRGGMSFALNRRYDSSNAQFYDMKVGSELKNYSVNNYYVQYQADRKRIITSYQVKYNENHWIEEDYNNDGVVDYSTSILDTTQRLKGIYETQGAANHAANQPLLYTVPSDAITRTDTRTNSVNSDFASYVMYNQNGYSGTLYKTGSPYVSSGILTPAHTMTKTDSCENSIPGKYGTDGTWAKTSDGTPCPQTISYNSEGYKGTLYRGTTTTIKDCNSTGTVGYICTKQFKAYYSGEVTKPSVDTRMYTQDYRGIVMKPESYGSATRYEAWQTSGSTRWRHAYRISGSQWIDRVPVESGSERETLATLPTESYELAVALREMLNASPGLWIAERNSFNYYVASAPAATLMIVHVGYVSGYTYFNETAVPMNEQLYPIGKGWSWDLPYVETEEGKQYVHTGGGRYQVENGTLKGYDWLGMSFTPNTSVTVGGVTSASVLMSVDGRIKQYFDANGRLIRIEDAYNNATDFTYTQHPTYGRKLLSQVRDAIGNTIEITYTATNVTLRKGNETVTYDKRSEDGIELLDAVTDAEGRKTTYSYTLSNAQFNLLGTYAERAKANPYALLTEVQHPTGVKTKYTYETSPVKRYMGRESTNEAYRIASRVDEQLYANHTTKAFNRQSYFYNDTDMGEAYGQTFTFSTTLNNGLTSVTSQYKKMYIDDETPMPIYLEQKTEAA